MHKPQLPWSKFREPHKQLPHPYLFSFKQQNILVNTITSTPKASQKPKKNPYPPPPSNSQTTPKQLKKQKLFPKTLPQTHQTRPHKTPNFFSVKSPKALETSRMPLMRPFSTAPPERRIRSFSSDQNKRRLLERRSEETKKHVQTNKQTNDLWLCTHKKGFLGPSSSSTCAVAAARGCTWYPRHRLPLSVGRGRPCYRPGSHKSS